MYCAFCLFICFVNLVDVDIFAKKDLVRLINRFYETSRRNIHLAYVCCLVLFFIIIITDFYFLSETVPQLCCSRE